MAQRFIQKCMGIYGNLYGYEKVNYVKSKTNVTIVCKKHGDFPIRPDHFLQGHDCPKCNNCYKWSRTEFIEECRKIHGSKYDYSLIGFASMKSMLDILCLTCNRRFIQRADAHKDMKQGCPYCSQSQGFSKAGVEWVESLRINYPDIRHALSPGGEFKIPNTGYSADGYSEDHETIFEYHGSKVHGCPTCFPDRQQLNHYKETMDVAYKRTQIKMKKIRELGYGLIIAWECGHVDNFED
jgi:hypothetical protein